ncbi:MAG: peptide-binding protein [Betaproteobacteria bacterium]
MTTREHDLRCAWRAALRASKAVGLACVLGHSACGAAATDVTTLRVHDTPSLLQALDRARADKRIHRIELGPGRYELEAPLLIDEDLSGSADQPLVIAGPQTRQAVLSGSAALPPLAWRPWTAGIWRAPLSGRAFQRLWSGQRLHVRARYPNLGAGAVTAPAHATAPERVRRWHDPAGAVFHAFHGNGWGGVDVPILGKSDDGSLVYGAQVGNNRAMPPSERGGFVDNVLEELDAPDEWYLDAKQGWLYYQPRSGARPPARGFRAGATDVLVRIEGRRLDVHDVRLEHLVFEDTEPSFLKATEPLLRSDWKFARVAAVSVENAHDVRIEKSEFRDLGGQAVLVSGRTEDIRVVANHIHDIGGTAIAFVGRPSAVRSPLFEYHDQMLVGDIDPIPGPRSDDYPKDSGAVDNLIHDIGLLDKQAAGIEISMAARIDVDHNTLYRMPRAAINVGDGTWGGHRITYNDAWDTVLETGDHGAFNGWGRDRWWHPDRQEMDRRVASDRFLVTLDAIAPILIRRNRLRCDRGWDIDLDDGASNYVIEENVLLAGGLKLREGFSRIVRNNLLVNGSFHPHVWFDDSGDVFEANIVAGDYQPVGMHAWGRRVDRNAFARMADLRAAQARGTDAHSVFGDPVFADTARGDFTVTNTVLTGAVGFSNFPMDVFGVRPAGLRALADRPRLPVLRTRSAEPLGEVPQVRRGLTFKSIETLGEQSVAGLASTAGVRVLAVEAGSAAEAAGLRTGDVIVGQIPGSGAGFKPIDRAAELAAALDETPPTASLELVVTRNQNRVRLHLPTR